MQDYRTLIGWQKSHEFVKKVYLITARFPSHEMFHKKSNINILINQAKGDVKSDDIL